MNIASSAAQFDPAYKAAQPKAVQDLMNMPNATREESSLELAQQGYIIDVPIMTWGWSPFIVMTERIAAGYTWVPSALMPPVTLAPGLSSGNVKRYEPTIIPAGAIIVTLDLDAIKTAYPAPAPTTPAAKTGGQGPIAAPTGA